MSLNYCLKEYKSYCEQLDNSLDCEEEEKAINDYHRLSYYNEIEDFLEELDTCHTETEQRQYWRNLLNAIQPEHYDMILYMACSSKLHGKFILQYHLCENIEFQQFFNAQIIDYFVFLKLFDCSMKHYVMYLWSTYFYKLNQFDEIEEAIQNAIANNKSRNTSHISETESTDLCLHNLCQILLGIYQKHGYNFIENEHPRNYFQLKELLWKLLYVTYPLIFKKLHSSLTYKEILIKNGMWYYLECGSLLEEFIMNDLAVVIETHTSYHTFVNSNPFIIMIEWFYFILQQTETVDLFMDEQIMRLILHIGDFEIEYEAFYKLISIVSICFTHLYFDYSFIMIHSYEIYDLIWKWNIRLHNISNHDLEDINYIHKSHLLYKVLQLLHSINLDVVSHFPTTTIFSSNELLLSNMIDDYWVSHQHYVELMINQLNAFTSHLLSDNCEIFFLKHLFKNLLFFIKHKHTKKRIKYSYLLDDIISVVFCKNTCLDKCMDIEAFGELAIELFSSYSKSIAIGITVTCHAPKQDAIHLLMHVSYLLEDAVIKTFEKEMDYQLAINQLTLPSFCYDALTCQILENPIRLPSSNQIVDYKTIQKHLYTVKSDPFDRTELHLYDLIFEKQLQQTILDKIQELSNPVIK